MKSRRRSLSAHVRPTLLGALLIAATTSACALDSRHGFLGVSRDSWITVDAFFSTEHIVWWTYGLPNPSRQKRFNLSRDPQIVFWTILNNPPSEVWLQAVLLDPKGLEVEVGRAEPLIVHPKMPLGRFHRWWNTPIPLQLLRTSGEWTVLLLVDGRRAGAASFILETDNGPSVQDRRVRLDTSWSAYRRAEYHLVTISVAALLLDVVALAALETWFELAARQGRREVAAGVERQVLPTAPGER